MRMGCLEKDRKEMEELAMRLAEEIYSRQREE